MGKHNKFLVLLAVSVALVFATFSRVNAAATITVNSTADNQANDGSCTLREAIIASNTDTASGAAVGECAAGSGAGDLIEFDISGSGLKTIHITSGLPSISRTVTIDGYSQTGASVNTADFPDALNGTLTVEIDAAGESGIYGIDINGSQADGSVIKGLIVNDIPYETFYLTDVDNVSLEGNYIGTSSTGNVADGGGSHGVRIGGNSTGNMIGGATAAKRNVISGNGNTGVVFYGSAQTTGNFVQGNYIGVGADGTTRIGNSQPGVFSGADATGNTIGGDGVGEGNIISGNGGAGVYLTGTGGANTVQGNYIGPDAGGSANVYNGGGGIVISNADSNVIGGSTAGARNVISGNSAYGIFITDDSDNNDIFGNYVGVNAAGDADLGNGVYGIYVDTFSEGNEIGSGVSGTGNVISGNDEAGIIGSGDNTTVKGNYIGTNATGTAAIGNTADGVSLGGDGWIIGGTASNDRNVISGNGGSGVRLNSADDTTFAGNYIGTNAAGNADLGNTQFGISLFGASNNNVIGGTTSASRNVISGNDLHGILFFNSGSTGNTISGNYIGVGSGGTTDIGNTGAGVLIGASSNANKIGGDTAGEANLIRFNDDNGVIVNGVNNAITGNSLYQNATPNIDLGDDGVTVNDANDADSGANDLLNYPEWSTYTESAGNTDVEYTLDVPAGDYRVETFSDNGKTLIDTQNITHTGSGSESFSNAITGDGYSSVRMTVTEIDGGLSSGFGSTSEYSASYSDGTATITVNSTADNEDNDGECTLREAITASNDDTESGDADGECIAGAGTDTIEFDIAGSGVHTIQPGSALPAITDSGLTINGYSQTGAIENAADYDLACFEGTIKIEIEGTNAGNDKKGIQIDANDVTVRGLAINRFGGSDGDGILVSSGSGATIAGNILGLDTDGLVDQGNGDGGIDTYNGADGITIGGSSEADRNLISGNDGYGGIKIINDAGTNSIKGNCIGTDATGDAAVPNASDGINYYNSDATNTIGGTSPGDKNVISGNGGEGINVGDNTVIDVIEGNYIGTNVAGDADLGNTNEGIDGYNGGAVTKIGGTASGARNVISGNDGSGIYVHSASLIQGNYVGLDASGTTDLGNSSAGIRASGAGTIVGGTAAGAENVVSGNDDGGILADADDDIVQGNLVGTSADGLSPIGNVSIGIEAAGNDVIVGGDTASERNVVSAGIAGGNYVGSGIAVLSFGSGLTGAIVQGNYVGTNINGAVGGGFGNAGFGVFIIGDYKEALIGGTGKGEGNKIVSSGFNGVNVNSFVAFGLYSTDNTIIGNSIYQNGGSGIRLMADTDGNFVADTSDPLINDADDADTGSNDFLNHPVLNSSSASTGSLDVNFDLDVPNTNAGVTGYRVDFFANDAGDASGNGEGQIYLGHADVSGDVTNHSETISLEPGVITTGTYDITATVTEIDSSTNGFSGTSEFSNFLDNQSVIQPLDNDGDGVNDSVENTGPNGGDGNGDGTQDSLQADVSTILDSTGDNYLTLELEDGGTCNQISDFSVSAETDQASADTGFDYPMGLNSFTIPCADSVNGKIFYHAVESLGSFTYRKYGPTTPGDSGTVSWYDSGFTYSTATVGSNTVATASFSLTDGALGDDTGNDDSIVDDNGPATVVSSSIGKSLTDSLAITGQNQSIYLLFAASIMSSTGLYIKKKISINNKRRK